MLTGGARVNYAGTKHWLANLGKRKMKDGREGEQRRRETERGGEEREERKEGKEIKFCSCLLTTHLTYIHRYTHCGHY